MDEKCPKCGNRLYWRKHGGVCKNHKCEYYWVSGKKPVYRWIGNDIKGEGIWRWMYQEWIPLELIEK